MKKNSNLLTILSREFAAYFNSPIAYVFMVIFTLLNSGLFMTQFFLAERADMRALFYTLPFFLSVFLPAISMRLWAEEKRGNTQELLLTFPMRSHELVLGKFFASFLFYLITLACTFPIPVMLAVLGRPDIGVILCGYIGAAFLGGFFLAIGTLVSGFYRDQIVAFILSMMVCLGLYLLGTEFVATSIDGWVPGFGTFLRHFLGVADHYGAFAKGVIDNRDVLYFVVGSVVALVLNGFWMEGRMRPKAASIFTTAALISAGIFLLSNWLVAGVPLGRFDMSEGKTYTISQATRKILKNLPSPVTVKFYISSVDKMPTTMKTLEQDARDKLEELRAVSDGHFQYQVIHMDAATVVEGTKKEDSLEERLAKKGLQPFRVESIQSDEVGVRLVYSGLIISYKEKPEEVLPQIHPGNLDDMEYAVISKLYRMTLPEIPKVALMAPFKERTVDPNLMMLLKQLGGGQVPDSFRDDPYEFLQAGIESEGYPVARIALNEKDGIPEGTKTLAVIQPTELSERQKYEINRFLCGGGSVFMAVQNHEFDYKPKENGLVEFTPNGKDPKVNDLLSAWGFGVDPSILADDQSEAITLSSGGRGGLLGISFPVKLPIQILLTDAEMNTHTSITARLSVFFYLWGSALKIDEKKVKAEGLKVETLLHSSKRSWTVPFKKGTLVPESLDLTPRSVPGPFPLAVLAEGQFADAFRGRKMPEWAPAAEADAAANPQEKASREGTPAPLSMKPGKLLLIGAATPFQKQIMQGGGHLNFFLNAMDVLTLGDALIGIRTKGQIGRALPKVSAPAKVAWRLFVTLLMPCVIALSGFGRAYARRRTKQLYIKSLKAS